MTWHRNGNGKRKRNRGATRRGDERGSAMVEAPAAIIVILSIGMGAFFIGNLVLRYHQLEEAVSSGARYGARAQHIPGGGPARRRTAAEIAAFTQQAAAPLGSVTVEITCGDDLATLAAQPPCANPELFPSGRYLQVRATTVVASNDPVMAIARSVNRLFDAIGAGEPFPPNVTVTDSSVALIE